MSAGQQSLRIDVGDRAGGGNIHVSAHQHRADGRAWLNGLRLMLAARGTDSHYGNEPCLGKLTGKLLDGLFAESAEHKGSVDRLHERSEALQIRPGSDRRPAHRLGHARRAHRVRLRAIHRVDFEHLLDRSNSANGLFGELADAIGNRSDELSIDVYRAAAHAGHDSRKLDFLPVQTCQDQVTFRTVQVAQNAENLYVHRFRLGTFKHRVGNAGHTAMQLAYR